MLAPDNTDPSEEQPLINPINTKIKLKYPKWLAYSILTSVPFLHLFSYLLSIYILGQYTYVYFLEAKYPNVTHTLSGSLSACTVNKSSIEYFIESDIQKEAAKWTIYVYLALLIPSFLMNINLATYSDALGRKAFFIIPLVGTLIKTALCALGIYLKLNVKILLAFYMVEAITGTWTGTIAMSFCFIADTTEPGKPRSFLIGLIEGGIGLGAILASFASGYLITWTNGFFYPIVIAAVLVGISLLIVILFIQETLHPARRRQNISLLRNMNRVLEVYRSGFSPDTPRWIFVVLIIIFMCSAAANLGKISVESIYFVDSPFCWSTEQIGIYGAMRIIFSNVCGIFVIKIFHIWTNDEVIALFGCLTTTACLILEGIARSNLVMYMCAYMPQVNYFTPLTNNDNSLY